MTDILRLLLHFGWLLLPVWALIAILWRRRDGWSLLAAVPLTFALLMLSAWAGAAVGMLRSVGCGWQLAALPAAGFLIAGRFRHRRMAFSAGGVAAGVLLALLQLLPTIMRDFPDGWDPGCHALIAERIRETGRLCADWRPFEVIPMRYPQAFHALVALLAQVTDLPVHRVLQGLHFLLMFPAGWMIWGCARTAFGGRAAWAALFLFAGVTNTGNYLYFYRMGMYPTELGFLLFLGTVWAGMVWRRGRWAVLTAGGLMMAALAVMHPLSLAMNALVWLGVWLAARSRPAGGFAWRILLIGGVVMACRWGPELLSRQPGENESLRFAEESAVSLSAFLIGVDPLAMLLALIGFWHWRRRFRPVRRRIWLVDAVVLFGLFGLLEYGFRYAVALPLTGEDFTLGIPSRLIGVAGGVLAVLGGAGIAACRSRQVYRVLLAGVILLTAARYIRLAVRGDDVSPELQELAAAVREKTPADACCILPAGMPDYQWFCYLAQRRSPALPLPSSEDRGDIMAAWAVFHDFDANREAIGDWLRRNRVPCFALVPMADGWRLAAAGEDGRLRLLPEVIAKRH